MGRGAHPGLSGEREGETREKKAQRGERRVKMVAGFGMILPPAKKFQDIDQGMSPEARRNREQILLQSFQKVHDPANISLDFWPPEL